MITSNQQTFLSYVTTDDSITLVYEGDDILIKGVSDFPTNLISHSDSRSLSISAVSNSTDSSESKAFSLFLLFEGADKNIKLMRGDTYTGEDDRYDNLSHSNYSYVFPDVPWSWTDMTPPMAHDDDQLFKSLELPAVTWNSSANISMAFGAGGSDKEFPIRTMHYDNTSFASTFGYRLDTPGIYVATCIEALLAYSRDILGNPRDPYPNNTITDLLYLTTPNLGLMMIQNTLACWIDPGQRLFNLDYNQVYFDNLLSPFPYTRIAATSTSNDLFYLYHQFNESTLVKDIYHVLPRSWSSSNLTVRAS